METKPKLLIVDDNEALLAAWRRALQRDFDVITATDYRQALEQFQRNPEIVLLDIRLREDDISNRQGLDLLQNFLAQKPHLPIVMISAYGDINVAVECMQMGAVDFVDKQNPLPVVRQRLKRAWENRKLSQKTHQMEKYIKEIDPTEIVGQSPAIAAVKEQIQMVARDGEISVLITGETGTGKELVAKAIHRHGVRKNGPFVAAPITAVPATLLESELFGFEPGTFTDAKKRKVGWIEEAEGGVLFLDEIGELPENAQVKLLRFLEERCFSRLGSTRVISVDVQVISATNRDLEKAIREGRLRDDLFYRLKGFQIYLPPLRERKEDIPLLVEHFLYRLRKKGRTVVTGISEEALLALQQYEWPGNIRELMNAMERAVLFANSRKHERIFLEDLPPDISKGDINQEPIRRVGKGKRLDLRVHLARAELACIEEALRLSKGKKSEAWKLLGLNDRFALRRRVKSLQRKFPEMIHEFPLVSKLFR